ncbi:MAG: hypothetical protein AB7O65_11360 [Candidatus Korobacteraceae bacterium]
MTKSTLFATLLLAGSMAFAQAGQGAPEADPQPGAQPGQGGMSSDQQTVRGCLTGTEGNYRLVSSTGATYQMTGDLSEYVGKEVEVSINYSGAGDPSAGAGAQSTMGSAKTIRALEVKQIADTCTSAAGAGAGGQANDADPGQAPQQPQQ